MTHPTSTARQRLLRFASSDAGRASGIAEDITTLLAAPDTAVGTDHIAEPQSNTAAPVAADPVYDSIAMLFAVRHQLPPDALRSLADIWSCGSAARYGGPHERFWDNDLDFYTEHDVEACENENADTDEVVIAIYDDAGNWSAVGRIPATGAALDTIRINADDVGYPTGTRFRLSLVRDFGDEDLELHYTDVQAI